MNGLLFLILTHVLIWQRFRAARTALELSGRLTALEQALRRRDYNLASAGPPLSALEQFCQACISVSLNRGQLQLEDISALGELSLAAAVSSARSESFLLAILLHGSLCGGLAILLHLGLSQSLGLSLRGDGASLNLIAILTYGLGLWAMLRAVPWPRPLRDEAWLRDFLQLWFTGEGQGEDADLAALLRLEQDSGYAQAKARQRVLMRRWRRELERSEGRLRLAEEWLGAWELGLSALLALLLWLPPLIARIPEMG